MLTRLSVKNLAVVEAAEAAFGPGLNVITGETGAGKSVLMGAIHLILGERADKSIIRTGEQEASVCAVYEPGDTRAIDTVLADADIPPCEDGVLLLRRSLSTSGSGKIRVNDAPATASLLRRLAPLLTDIHGPNDNQSLLNPDFQLRLVTAYAGAERESEAYHAALRKLQALRSRLAKLEGAPGERMEEMELLAEQIREVRDAGLSEDDGDDLVMRHAQAANAEEILSMGNALLDRLTDGENPVAEQLTEVNRALRDLSRLLPESSEWADELSGIQAGIQELSRSMAIRLSQIESDPEALETLERRMALVQRLRRRYGPSLEDVFRHCEEAQSRLDEINAAAGDIFRLKDSIALAEKDLMTAGRALSERRAAALPKLSGAITAELRGLGFAKASFPIEMIPCAPGPEGIDSVCFSFEPNPGEEKRPLADIASSGEIARVMLAVKVVLAAHDAIPTLIFDEIDANIGGETGRRVGEKLRKLGSHVQILCITHQPQAAVYGQSHFRVRKQILGGRTVTDIEQLREDARPAEIARMLGGSDFTPVTLEHAREMLRAASELSPSRPISNTQE